MQDRAITELVLRMNALEAQQATTAKAAKETADLVKEIYDALMKRSPGQDGSFLDRATDLLISVESGSRLFNWVVAAGKLVLALGTLSALAVAFWKFGGKP